jgi:hypothetical protein
MTLKRQSFLAQTNQLAEPMIYSPDGPEAETTLASGRMHSAIPSSCLRAESFVRIISKSAIASHTTPATGAATPIHRRHKASNYE